MTNTRKLMEDPHNISLSIIIPTINFKEFQKLHTSLVETCSNTDDVEMVLKIDDSKNMLDYYNLCEGSPFKYKILLYPTYNSRLSLHLFYNDLGNLASGKIIWILNDDVEIVHGDWYKALTKTRNHYKDNIYVAMVPFDNGKGTKQLIPTPAFSKEWVKFCGHVTMFPNYDRWITEMARFLDRRVEIKEKDLLITMPKGRRVMSGEDRKKIFYPKFEKVSRKLQRKLKKL